VGLGRHQGLPQLKAQIVDGIGPGGVEVSVDTEAETGAQKSTKQSASGAHFVRGPRRPRLRHGAGAADAGRVRRRHHRQPADGPLPADRRHDHGLSMALHEEGPLDVRFDDYANHDFAGYHVATCADVGRIDAEWLDEHDSEADPMGTKGIGEIGIVGSAAAVANAVWHATGIRVRDLPIQLDKLLAELPESLELLQP